MFIGVHRSRCTQLFCLHFSVSLCDDISALSQCLPFFSACMCVPKFLLSGFGEFALAFSRQDCNTDQCSACSFGTRSGRWPLYPTPIVLALPLYRCKCHPGVGVGHTATNPRALGPGDSETHKFILHTLIQPQTQNRRLKLLNALQATHRNLKNIQSLEPRTLVRWYRCMHTTAHENAHAEQRGGFLTDPLRPAAVPCIGARLPSH